MRCRLPDRAAALVEEASAFAAGNFTFLGYPPVVLTRPIAYDVDPFTSTRWPQKHGLLLDYRTATVGDPKWIWELNRLQHVPLLLAASVLTDDSKIADLALADVDAWLAQASPGRGIAWSNGYEAALRAISLALSLDALRSIRAGSTELRERLLDSLAQHVHWIRRYPSLFSSANNHRVGELVGIIVTARLAPELRLDVVAREALAELRLRCDEQFARDGGHREQSFAYTLFTLELLLLTAGALRGRNGEVLKWLEDVFLRAAAALRLQFGPDDPDPRYGDSDDGGATLLGGRSARGGRAVLAAVHYALGELAPEDDPHLDPSAVWLFGVTCRRRQERMDLAESSGWLKDTGIVLLRAGKSSVSFDVGELGFGRLAAHGHADALHITVAHGGSRLVGDPGTGSYFGSPRARSVFRGTGCHPTVMVDSLDQADQVGPFLWGRRPTVRVLGVDLDRRLAEAEHDGYGRLHDPVIHRRSLRLLDDGLLLVRDALTADAQHAYSQRWPFPPSAVVELQVGGSFYAELDDKTVLLHTVCSAPCEPSLVCGSLEPFEGWWSEGLESMEPTPLVKYEAVVLGGLEFVTLLSFGSRAEAPAEAKLEVDWDARACVVMTGSERVVGLDGMAATSLMGVSA